MDEAIQAWVNEEAGSDCLVTEYVVIAVATDMATGDVAPPRPRFAPVAGSAL